MLPPDEGGAVHDGDPARLRDGAAEAVGGQEHYVAGCVFLQHDGADSRIRDILVWQFQRSGVAYHDGADVHRRVPRLDRFFVFLRSLFTSSTNRPPEAFRRRIPNESLHKATTIISLGLLFVIVITALICHIEPSFSLSAVLFEVVSALGTVGLTVGITPSLSVASRLLIILTMYIGRLGPLTVASMWVREPDTGISLPEENLSIG